jgi:hypothetical protein
MSVERFICCLKYGTAYPTDYVNVLFNAARKAMHGPFRFICLTDRPEGLVPGIEALPIPDLGLQPQEWFVGGVWPKLGIYDRHFHGLKGRMLFIDLDMVVLRDLDAFFDMPGPFIGIDAGPAWGRPASKAPPQLGSGIVAFDIGAHGRLAERFRSEKALIMGRYRTEQAFTEAELGDISFWPDGWVISFKRFLRQPLLLDLVREPRRPPRTAKVLAFHGTPRPADLIGQGRAFWDRFPHLGHGPVSWMVDYWRDNGGGRLQEHS